MDEYGRFGWVNAEERVDSMLNCAASFKEVVQVKGLNAFRHWIFIQVTKNLAILIDESYKFVQELLFARYTSFVSEQREHNWISFDYLEIQ